ncbi:potassium-transporting ATPase, a subunit [Candidatus Magnetoovum chiemensis]|nr:potassium-transporting ATPase, a subunit [Candidatus Magnetoovum chiemensis]
MNNYDYLTIVIYLGALALSVPLLGTYMELALNNYLPFNSRIISKMEIGLYKICGINHLKQMSHREYLYSVLVFNLFGFALLMAIMLFQKYLPFNPQGLEGVPFFLALNTAVSFVTNTNWQAYSGEAVMSYFTQAMGLCVQNFVSAATGIAVFMALARGIVKQEAKQLGNFWVDLTRTALFILIPMSFILAVLLMNEGVVQSLSGYVEATTLEGAEQVIPMGAAASQIAIKQLGTNGGGFFGVNSAHPFENPTPLSNFLQTLAILIIPAALTYTYGRVVGKKKEGLTLFYVMSFIFLVSLGLALYFEYCGYPKLFNGLTMMEGKETRFSTTSSVLWGMATTVASNGSVNAMHSSFSPITGGLAILNMMFGEIVFGGVGSGMYGMLMFVILTVFITGLMVGRTPEYLGKKIEQKEIIMAAVAIIQPGAFILIGSLIAVLTNAGLSSLSQGGPHGLMEILYAFTSASQNNGSAFAGLSVNTNFYNIMLAICMIAGRYGVIVPVLIIAGSLSSKKHIPASSGTFTTDNALFAALLVAIIIIVGALTFFPALSVGSIVEHLIMTQ